MENHNKEKEHSHPESTRKGEANHFDSLFIKNLARLKDEDIERRKALMKKLVKKINQKKHEELKAIKKLGLDKHPALRLTKEQFKMAQKDPKLTKLPIIVLPEVSNPRQATRPTKIPKKPQLWNVISKENLKMRKENVITTLPEKLQRPKTSLGLIYNNNAFSYKSPECRANEIQVKLETDAKRLQEMIQTNRHKKEKDNSGFGDEVKVFQPIKAKYFHPMNLIKKPVNFAEKNCKSSSSNFKENPNVQTNFTFAKSNGTNGVFTTFNSKFGPSPYSRPYTAKPKSKASLYFTQAELSNPYLKREPQRTEKIAAMEPGKNKSSNSKIIPLAFSNSKTKNQTIELKKLYRNIRLTK